MRRHAIYQYLPVFLLILLFSNLYASDSLPITHLGIEQGLSNNSIRSIFRDSKGFMWFGTYDGLNCYDGYSFKVFRNKINDSASLPHNFIYCINEDKNNNLWVGTGQGIGIYNALTSKMRPAFFSSYPAGRTQKVVSAVNSIQVSSKGTVYIGTYGNGFLVQQPGAAQAVQVPLKKGKAFDIDYQVQSIVADENNVWLFIRDVGLCRYNQTDGIQVVNSAIKSVLCMATDGYGNIWLGNNNGLYRYTIATNTSINYKEETGKLNFHIVASLCLDKKGELWIGTEGGGINILNIATGSFRYIVPGEHKNALSSESVYAIYEDKEARKWIGTLKGGVDIIDGTKSRFATIQHDPLDKNSLIYNFVASFYEDNNKNLWIGTDGGGFSIWNRKENKFTNYRHITGNNTSLSNNLVTCITRDYLGNTWLATFGGGINKFDIATGRFEHFNCTDEAYGIDNSNAWLIYEDKDKNLWASTYAQGRLYKFNRQTNRFEVFTREFIEIFSIAEDRKGTLWMGNPFYLIKIDKQNKKHTLYPIGKPVRSIKEDAKGNFWIGTEGGGLLLFNRKLGKIETRYSDADGLCNNAVLNILEDSTNNLWLSTFNGLSKFDPAHKTFQNFYQGDGLQSNQFSYSAALRLQSGEMAFGGIHGFNLFTTGSAQSRNYMPPVMFTGIRVNNAMLTDNTDYIVKAKGDEIEQLEIPFNEAVLSFDFAALEYSSPGKISYAYFLDGWDKGWNYTGKQRSANYSRLTEGTYTFRVKATNAEGVWNPQEKTIRITVLPPWYRSWWAYLLYIVCIVGVGYYYITYKNRQNKLEYEIKLAHVNAEKEKELNEKKLSFFTNISHEFRTPLTLIIDPVKELMKTVGSADKEGHMNIVYRNARRLLSLVDQLLLFRKADSDTDQLRVTKIDFTHLCKEVYLCFVQQAKSKKINYHLACGDEPIEIYADWEKMEIIFFNLISNAIKFTPEGGSIYVSLEEMQNKIAVTVKDTGVGVPEGTGEQLFSKFYQVQNNASPFKSGFGVGLYVVKSFVDRHYGHIAYTSSKAGTMFTVALLKGKEHFNNEEIFEAGTENSVFLNELVEEDEITGNFSVKEELIEDHSLDTLVTATHSMLIADDNKEIRQYIYKVFKNSFNIYEAEDGVQALEMVKQHLPDIVLSDIRMPGITGVELCYKIKQDAATSHIPVVLLTASPEAETKLKGIEGGADDYITKPFEKELLLARVNSILKSRDNLQQYFYNEITLQQNTLKISPEDKAFLDRCIALVEENMDKDDFTIKVMAAQMGMSHSNLYKKMKIISGQSLNGFIRFIRLRKAARLFIDTDCNVNEAAMQVGITDTKYFREQFFKLFAMNPSAYIKKYRKPFQDKFTVNDRMVKSER